ncbi:MAG: energy transducer TonB [FCB group bacterium]|nr:energy transducer TonB [FCB group bacterium]
MRKSLLLSILSIFLLVGCGPKEKRVIIDESGQEYSQVIKGWDLGIIPGPDKFIWVDVLPELKREAQPEYPKRAMEDGRTGSVIVQAYVAADGRIKKAEIIKCSNHDLGFEKAALDAAFKSLFKPAMANGKPIGVWISYKVIFTLKGK